jgi:hypothetical protein
MANNGYGVVDRKGKRIGAHRMAWMLTNGEISKGLHCCHRCDNPKCCNPSHLFLGTNAENMRDMFNKGRHRMHTSRNPNRGRFGEKHQRASVTDAQALEIISKYKSDNTSHRKLAKEFGVVKTTIGRIIRGDSYPHLVR